MELTEKQVLPLSPLICISGFYSLARPSTRSSCVFLALLVLLLSQEYLRTIAERNLGTTTEYRAIFQVFYLKRLGGSPVALSV